MTKQNQEFQDLEWREKPKRWIVWFAFLLFIVLVTWAYFAKIDEATTGAGKVIPSQKVQMIHHLEGGIVQNIYVKEGDEVQAGQPLLQLADTRFSSSFKEKSLKVNDLQAAIVRLNAEINNQPFIPPEIIKKKFPEIIATEVQVYNSRIKERAAQLSVLKNQVTQKEQYLAELGSKAKQLTRSHELVAKELALTTRYAKSGSVSEVEYLRIQRAENDMKGELNTTLIEVQRAESSLEETINKITEFELGEKTKIIDELNEAEAELSQLVETQVTLQDQVNRTEIKSPVNGTIKRLYVNTIGSVVHSGKDLIEIVPTDSSLLIEARVRPSDIAFLYPGQPANIKITAYDFTIYGGLDGKLEQISADTITDEEGETYYEILVRTDRNYLEAKGKQLEIIPGMTATVDIITGQKTVMQYLLKPILRAKYTALRER